MLPNPLKVVAFFAAMSILNTPREDTPLDPEPKQQKLIDQSKLKNSIVRSGLFGENPLDDADVPGVLKYISSNADYSSYHLLYAIRAFYPDEYKKISTKDKAKVLCSALKNVKCLNDWGYLSPKETFDYELAKALIAIGPDAVPNLVPLLDDDNPAPLFGSQAATGSRTYQYRRKDFAYRYLSILLGESPRFLANPADRDKDIKDLKRRVQK